MSQSQLPPLPGHPEPHSMKWSELELAAIKEYGEQCARAALAANEKQPSRATDITTALSLPGCERLKEWAEIGPVQRAAVEEFAYALAAKVPADALATAIACLDRFARTNEDMDALAALRELTATPAPAPEADPCLVLWKAMNQAGKVGNCTDDKLIVKFLREAGYCIAPAPAPEADPCLVLWKAMNQAGKVGNRTDDKLIVKFLRDAGYRIAPAPAPEAVKRYAICYETEQICSACPTRGVACEAAKPEAQPLTAMQARSVVDGMGWALDEVEIEDMEMLVKAAERACAEAWGVKLGASGEASNG